MSEPVIAVLAGGTSAEREVSLGSGRACAAALARSFATQLFVVETEAIPPGLSRDSHVVFSTLHGTFGEDGGMQRLLDAAGIVYAGCDAESSALTMDKARTKEAVARRGLRVADSIVFEAGSAPDPAHVVASAGEDLVLKPNNEGSSVGLRLIGGASELRTALGGITAGRWMIERRLRGREMSVGVLGGKAMGIVEIRPHSGVYDYESKYTKGRTEYLAPAPLEADESLAVQRAAEAAFAACRCRDYARVDFIFCGGAPFFLEINTLPGMKETSLLPMSARCAGLDFVALVREMVRPALARFRRSAVPP